MYNQKVKSIFDQGNVLYLTAKEEMARPVKDVVNYMVCLNALNAIRKYLTGFALQSGIEVKADLPLESLYEACKKVDVRFADLRLDPLLSILEDEYEWLDIKMVNKFIERVEMTRRLAVNNN